MFAQTLNRARSDDCEPASIGPQLAGHPAGEGGQPPVPVMVRASQKFTLSQIRAFVGAARHGTFSRAALDLGISQSALSRCIKDLELALGVGLFERSSRGVGLSRAGRAVLPKAEQLVLEYAKTQAFLAAQRSRQRGVLRVAADASVAPVVLDTLTRMLRRHAPAVDLELLAMGSEEAVHHVSTNTASLGLCGSMEGHPMLRYTPVLAAQLGLIVPPGCNVPESPGSLDDLEGIPFVRLADCTPVTRTLRQHDVHFPAYFDSRVVYTCLSAAFDSMREKGMVAVATGIGASLPQTHGMRFIPLPGLLPSLSVYLVSARYADCNPLAEQLRDLVRTSVHDSPWHPSVQRLNRVSLPA